MPPLRGGGGGGGLARAPQAALRLRGGGAPRVRSGGVLRGGLRGGGAGPPRPRGHGLLPAAGLLLRGRARARGRRRLPAAGLLPLGGRGGGGGLGLGLGRRPLRALSGRAARPQRRGLPLAAALGGAARGGAELRAGLLRAPARGLLRLPRPLPRHGGGAQDAVQLGGAARPAPAPGRGAALRLRRRRERLLREAQVCLVLLRAQLRLLLALAAGGGLREEGVRQHLPRAGPPAAGRHGEAVADEVRDAGQADARERLRQHALRHLAVDLRAVGALVVGQAPRGHLQDAHAEGVDVHALVRAALVQLGCHVVGRAQRRGGGGGLAVGDAARLRAARARRQPQVADAHRAVRGGVQHVLALDVAVHDGRVEGAVQVGEAIQDLAAALLDHLELHGVRAVEALQVAALDDGRDEDHGAGHGPARVEVNDMRVLHLLQQRHLRLHARALAIRQPRQQHRVPGHQLAVAHVDRLIHSLGRALALLRVEAPEAPGKGSR